MAQQKRVTKKQQAIAYLNSKTLKVRKAEGHPAIDAVTDHLFKEMSGISVRYAEEYRRHIKIFLLDLYLTYCEDPERYVAYSRDHNQHVPGKKNHRLGLSPTFTPEVADFLTLKRKGYAEGPKGFHDRNNPYGKSYRARIRAKDKLIKLVEDYGITPEIEDDLPGDDDDDRLVILRDTKVGDETVGKEIDYDDTPETLKMKENLQLINSNPL